MHSQVDLRPAPAGEADARCISAQRAVAWLRAAAQAGAGAVAKVRLRPPDHRSSDVGGRMWLVRFS